MEAKIPGKQFLMLHYKFSMYIAATSAKDTKGFNALMMKVMPL